MEQTNVDYLRFSAYSIKELITRKLSQDSRFTDQVYEGSNLAVLIDIFSYMAQCLLYSLNTTAAESMFSDVTLYENMNRLCKMIGYHPQGVGAMTAQFGIQLRTTANEKSEFNNKTILKYSAIKTDQIDDAGNEVYYSTVDDHYTGSGNTYTMAMFNGRWRLYSTQFVSNGQPYQTFKLNGMKSDSSGESDSKTTFVPSKMIHVYVDEASTAGSDADFVQYVCVDEGVFTDNHIENGAQIYTAEQEIVDIRLAEDKTYEITFGNGFTGKIPPKDSKIYVMYLDANGPGGEIVTGQVTEKRLMHNPGLFGIDNDTYKKIFHLAYNQTQDAECLTMMADQTNALWSNFTNSTTFVAEESVDDIRTTAPEWFKTGNRLVTKSDYIYFFKNKNRDYIVDAVCQNNYEYVTSFYRWLYNIGLNGKRTDIHGIDGKFYINQSRMFKYDLAYVDPADSNNIYMWIKMRNNSAIMREMFQRDIRDIKMITQEPVFLEPLDVYFTPCAQTVESAMQYFEDKTSFDPDNKNYIEITLDDNCLYTALDITHRVENIIVDFFDESNMKLGQIVDYSALTQQIYGIGGISRIRTIYNNNEGQELPNYANAIIKPGLSFATWTSTYIEPGDDLEVTNTSMSLEPFQFPKIYKKNSLAGKIKVIKKSLNNINTVQY